MAAADPASGLLDTFTAGVIDDAQRAAFKEYATKMQAEAPQEKKDAFKAKIEEVLDSIEDETPNKLETLIKGIRDVISAKAVEKGKTGEVPEEIRAKMRANLKAYFEVEANNMFSENYNPEAEGSHDMKTTIKGIVSAFMAVGFTILGGPEN